MQVIPTSKKNKLLKEIYNKSLRGRDSIYESYIKGKFVGISKADVNRFLKTQKTHQLHTVKYTSKRVRPLIVRRPLVRWQVDLIEFRGGYIMTIMDTFSKYAYAKMLQYKTANNTTNVLSSIFNKDYYPKIMHTDNGTEFSAAFDRLLTSYGIKHIRGGPYTSTSQSMIERFNKTLMGMLHKRFTQDKNQQLTVAVLQQVVTEYNNTFHSTTKKKPIDLHIFNINDQLKVGTKTASKAIKTRARKITAFEDQRFPKLTIGDKVRLALVALPGKEKRQAKSGIGSKSYKRVWTYEIYTVQKVTKPTKSYNLPRYYISGDQGQNAKFYQRDELLKV